jgi:hypothetical protein
MLQGGGGGGEGGGESEGGGEGEGGRGGGLGGGDSAVRLYEAAAPSRKLPPSTFSPALTKSSVKKANLSWQHSPLLVTTALVPAGVLPPLQT